MKINNKNNLLFNNIQIKILNRIIKQKNINIMKQTLRLWKKILNRSKLYFKLIIQIVNSYLITINLKRKI